MQLKPEDAHRQLGRKLLAAILSERLGLASIDYTLRRHVPEDINPCWGELGWQLLYGMSHAVTHRLQQAQQEERKKKIHMVVDNTDLPF